MDVLAKISKPVEDDLVRYRTLFEADFEHRNPLLNLALQHILKRQGKRLRPILMMLVARTLGPVRPNVLHASVSIEELHTASLLHDDVVDESDRRRGQASVNALLSSQAAVLVGDFLLSKSLQHSAATDDVHVVDALAVMSQMLADGELLQMYNVSAKEIREASYYEVIKRKTACLFSTSAQIGAMLQGAELERVEAARLYAENLGICFQIRDDVFDYLSGDEVGKPIGNDMREGKLTLPVLHALLQNEDMILPSEEGEASAAWPDGIQRMREIAFRVKERKADEAEMRTLAEFAVREGGVDYAYSQMELYSRRALEYLDLLPDSDAKDALRVLAEYVITRKV